LEVRFRDRSVVDSEDTLHDGLQFGRYGQDPGAAPVGATIVLILVDSCSERFGKAASGSRQEHTASSGRTLDDDQAVVFRECLDLRNIGGVGAIVRGVLLPRKVIACFGSLVCVEAARR
jgi:hypothetical protein